MANQNITSIVLSFVIVILPKPSPVLSFCQKIDNNYFAQHLPSALLGAHVTHSEQPISHRPQSHPSLLGHSHTSRTVLSFAGTLPTAALSRWSPPRRGIHHNSTDKSSKKNRESKMSRAGRSSSTASHCTRRLYIRDNHVSLSRVPLYMSAHAVAVGRFLNEASVFTQHIR